VNDVVAQVAATTFRLVVKYVDRVCSRVKHQDTLALSVVGSNWLAGRRELDCVMQIGWVSAAICDD
jgi:hypothetical protein